MPPPCPSLAKKERSRLNVENRSCMVEESDFDGSWKTTSQALVRFYLRIAASKCQICTKMVLGVWENTDRQGSREGGRQESTARAASPPLACAWVRESRTVALYVGRLSILSCFVSCFNALQAADAPRHGHLTSLVAATAAYVCVCALYVGFVHPHALPSLPLCLSVGLSPCVS